MIISHASQPIQRLLRRLQAMPSVLPQIKDGYHRQCKDFGDRAAAIADSPLRSTPEPRCIPTHTAADAQIAATPV